MSCHALKLNYRHREGLVADVSGPQRNACPGTLSGETVCALGEAEVEDGVDAGMGELGSNGEDLGLTAGDAVEGEGEVVLGERSG